MDPHGAQISAWAPGLEGITEVFHADFVGHAYPKHTHDQWSLMLVDRGTIAYDLDHRAHGAAPEIVTLLPPGIAHDGVPVTEAGFRQRILYLETSVLGEDLVGRAVDCPEIRDPLLRHRIDQLHSALGPHGESLEAESRLGFIGERLNEILSPHADRVRHTPTVDERVANQLRELLDARLTAGITMREASSILQRNPTYLIKNFTTHYGLPPHKYVTGRRIDLARRAILAGRELADVAVDVGFHDQAHLSRHFVKHVGAPPGRYALNVAGRER
ncbi:AraC family transcriptional regulator [Rhodococcus erythropolis]|uniref:helix-turn-helix domain-containing protein n=1 Tax=Rhodococcus erythropolis TaxID=1833 RepID=UPI001E4168C2|nr:MULTISPECIES: AraC family transcriptional regulator [Rhodococcus erythropolis group]MCD2106711.1 AraC family transcriptional regulator [Rhodococcus qingshengii]MCZ4526122.1 AraC family transcriptional regulator [Rhodococcus erythropolis]